MIVLPTNWHRGFMREAANKRLIKLLFKIGIVFLWVKNWTWLFYRQKKPTQNKANNQKTKHWFHIKWYNIILKILLQKLHKNACTAASEYSPVSIQTPGKSQLPSRMSHERQGNHRQWCGPLQGKPRCGGIPLRKSTPPPPPPAKKTLLISGSPVCSRDQSQSRAHPVQVRSPNRRRFHSQRLEAIGRGGTKGRSILSVLTTAPSLAGDVGMGI